jgi:hypothetical protein
MLRADLYRLKNSRALLYTVLVGAVLIAAFVFVFKYTGIDRGMVSSAGVSAGTDVFGVSLVDLHRIPGAIDVAFRVAGKGDFIPLMIAVFVCIYATNEFSYGTVKNILAVGYKKTSFYFSKLITVCLSSVIIFLSIVFASFVAGSFFFKMSSEISDVAQLLLTLALQLLLHIAYAAIFFMIAVLVKNTGISIAASVGALIFLTVLFIAADWIFKTGSSIQSFWPAANISELTVPSPTISMIIRALLVGSACIIAPTVAGSLVFSRQDVN